MKRMKNWLFIKERESQKWLLWGELPKERIKEGRKVRYVQRRWIYPKPENVSPFIECHKIIDAESEEEAWQKLSLT